MLKALPQCFREMRILTRFGVILAFIEYDSVSVTIKVKGKRARFRELFEFLDLDLYLFEYKWLVSTPSNPSSKYHITLSLTEHNLF